MHAVSAEHDLGLRELRASLSALSRRGSKLLEEAEKGPLVGFKKPFDTTFG